MPDPVSIYTSYGVHGLLLIAVFWLVKVIVYQNTKIEALNKEYVDMVKEQVAVLTKLSEHIDE